MEGLKIISLDSEFIVNSLEKDYDEKIPNDLGIISYDMYRCPKCSLVYASPLRPGSSNFYAWVTRHEGYYPSRRWEWDIALAYIRKYRVTSILEVGCGNGAFLKKCLGLPGVRVVGLDTNQESVDECRNNGIETYCESVESYAERHNEKFDIVLSFHCFEHVNNPKTFIRSQLALLKKGGKILVSTPYTATPGEQWYETLNYPPHHMTQWNRKAYEELAKQLSLRAKLFMPKDKGLKYRIIYSLSFMSCGLYKRNTYSKRNIRSAVVKYGVIHPVRTLTEILRHLTREKINVFNLESGKEIERYQVADYVTMVELSS